MRTRAFQPLLVDLGERLFAITLAIPFLWAFAKVLPLHPNVIVIAASEMLTVFLLIVRRRGDMVMTPLAILVGFAGTALPLLARPGGVQLIPAALSTAIMTSGFSLSVISKLYLNRSFGLIAANRGVKINGPYRLVRHPMYLGYFTVQLGFLAFSFSLTNFAVYVLAWTVQLLRIREEESVLRQDMTYQLFTRRVPSRLIPGVF